MQDRVFQRWQQLHPDNKEHVVPFFTLKTSVRKMSGTSAEVLNIMSAKADAELLKMLLSKAGEQYPDFRWTFVPTGINLIESPDIVKSALRTQNEYCANVTTVTIEGITEE